MYKDIFYCGPCQGLLTLLCVFRVKVMNAKSETCNPSQLCQSVMQIM